MLEAIDGQTCLLQRGKEFFKAGGTKIIADKGTAKVKENDDGSIDVIGGKNVSAYSNKENTRISFTDSEISQFIANQGRSYIRFNNCRFYNDGDRKVLNIDRVGSSVKVTGPNNIITVNGDLKGKLKCYSYGDNNRETKDIININGDNHASITSGVYDIINISKQDFGKNERLDDVSVRKNQFNDAALLFLLTRPM